jgi:hypothetical protein
MTEMEPAAVSGEELRSCCIRRAFPDGGFSWETHTDLRGSPIGDKVLVWGYDRLVQPRAARGSVRDHVEIMYCAAGWHSTGGTADAPDDPAVCHTIHSPHWRKHPVGEERFRRFWEFHAEHPVVWIVKTSAPGGLGNHHFAYCDPELPPEYRPGEFTEERPQ